MCVCVSACIIGDDGQSAYIASHMEYVYLLHFISYSRRADTLSYSVTERVTKMLLDTKMAGCVISRFIGATASSRQVVCEGERERVHVCV